MTDQELAERENRHADRPAWEAWPEGRDLPTVPHAGGAIDSAGYDHLQY